MTATASGTPLIIAVLALGISALSAVGSIAAVLMAQWNVQWQIRATTRESWLREFRQQVAALLANQEALAHRRDDIVDGGGETKREAEIKHALRSAYHTLRLLLAERGALHEMFVFSLDQFMRPEANEEEARSLAFWAEDVLRLERSFERATRFWAALRFSLGLGRVRWPLWSRFVAWCRRDPPRFPT